MIYTITFNPSLDYSVNVNDLVLGETNRVSSEYLNIGGKGINCAVMLKNFDLTVTTTGFLADKNNDLIIETLKEKKIILDFVSVNGNVRINVKIKSNLETEINALGALISNIHYDKLWKKIETYTNKDWVIISGNLANGMKQQQLEKMLSFFSENQIPFSLDIDSKHLLSCLKYEPIIIKPNLKELELLLNEKLKTKADIIAAGLKLQEKGAKNVLISLGKSGSIFINEDQKVYQISASKGKVISSVGAGDSMLASFIAHYFIKKMSITQSLKWAAAAGSATTFNKWIANYEEIKALLSSIIIKEI